MTKPTAATLRCRVSGRDDGHRCPSGCRWVKGEDLCSRCLRAAKALEVWMNGGLWKNLSALAREARKIHESQKEPASGKGRDEWKTNNRKCSRSK